MDNATGRGDDGNVTERERAGRIGEEDGGEGWEGWEAVVVVSVAYGGRRGVVRYCTPFSCGSRVMLCYVMLCMRRGHGGKETVWFGFNVGGPGICCLVYLLLDGGGGLIPMDEENRIGCLWAGLTRAGLSWAELRDSKAYNWHPYLSILMQRPAWLTTSDGVHTAGLGYTRLVSE